MFEISFFAAEAAFTAIWLLIRISIWIRQKSIDWKREAVLALMYINLAVIIRFELAMWQCSFPPVLCCLLYIGN